MSPDEPPTSRWQLRVLDGPLRGATHLLRERTSIGRSASSDLQIIDTGVSHRFCCDSAQDGSSYCADHHALCTIKPAKQREMRLPPSVLEQGYAPTPKEVLEPAF